jgi:imidazole glycerol-phosphate synthase subunit HisH
VIAIVDYGMGNLRSVEKALQKLGHHARITASPADVRAADRVILPGVGAFGACMANLTGGVRGQGSGVRGDDPISASPASLADVVVEAARSGRPFLGICVGMQLLFSEGEEMGTHRGLDVIAGRVVRFGANGDMNGEWSVVSGEEFQGSSPLTTHHSPLKVPHMGWNALRQQRDCPLLCGVPDGAMVYFVHSYVCRPEDPEVVVATADHGGPFCAALGKGNMFATQFHPEKSGDVGLRMLDNFARL